jgi:uncharacterized protein YwqG
MLKRNKQRKASLDAAFRAEAKPATEMKSVTLVPVGHVFPATSTHFGGMPYFTAGDSWPCLEEDGRPYDFICQINLNDCPVRPDVPFDLFLVFLCWALVESEDVDFELACIVRTYRDVSNSKAIQIPRPSTISEDDYRVQPCTVHLDKCMTYPSWSMKEYPAIASAAAEFRNPRSAIDRSLKRLGFLHDFRSRIGGYPTWVHDNTLEGEDSIILAQIDYHHEARNCIGDSAPIYISVSSTEPLGIETDVFQTF